MPVSICRSILNFALAVAKPFAMLAFVVAMMIASGVRHE